MNGRKSINFLKASFHVDLDSVIRSLHRELGVLLPPFQHAIAIGDRARAIALQHQIDFISGAMLVVYHNMSILECAL